MEIEITVKAGKEIGLWVECALCRKVSYIVLDMVPPIATPALVFVDEETFEIPGAYVCEKHPKISLKLSNDNGE